ncbi:hypothetical protein [Candidatus Sororendozoicomonas aggregata]|uniref:hypothetical protein n=1 Tax=Candidatus Sororendozoicomonas aggregata TaxID=3073239 RepID=UPI002ED0F3B1
MSIKFDGSTVRLSGLDAARFLYKEGHGLKKAFMGLFNGMKVTRAHYDTFYHKHKNTSITKERDAVKMIHDRNIERSGVTFAEEDTYHGAGKKDRDYDENSERALNFSRYNLQFSDKKLAKRFAQDELFLLIKDRFEREGLPLSTLDEKNAEEIMKILVASTIFTPAELADIRENLGDELDTSPYWK